MNPLVLYDVLVTGFDNEVLIKFYSDSRNNLGRIKVVDRLNKQFPPFPERLCINGKIGFW